MTLTIMLAGVPTVKADWDKPMMMLFTTPLVMRLMLFGPLTIACVTVADESTLPLPFNPSYNVTANASVATGALRVTMQTVPPAPVEQLGDEGVRFTDAGVPPLTLIVADCVAGEIYFTRRWVLCVAAALGILIVAVTRAEDCGTDGAACDGDSTPPPQPLNVGKTTSAA
jgi:hypothetical protein